MGGFLSGRTSLTTVQTADIADDAVTEAKMATDAIGLTELKAGTDGEVISWDASGNPVAIGAGTSGHFLKSQGAGSVPVFAADSKGGMTFINSTDISDAATYNFTAVDASSYDAYHFLLQNVIPVTDNVQFHARTSTNGGSSYDSGGSDYAWDNSQWATYTRLDADAEILLTGNTSGTAYTVGSAADEPGLAGWIWLIGPHLTSFTAVSSCLNMKSASAYYIGNECFAYRLEAADVDAFQLYFSSGNIESGTITAYGIANA